MIGPLCIIDADSLIGTDSLIDGEFMIITGEEASRGVRDGAHGTMRSRPDVRAAVPTTISR